MDTSLLARPPSPLCVNTTAAAAAAEHGMRFESLEVAFGTAVPGLPDDAWVHEDPAEYNRKIAFLLTCEWLKEAGVVRHKLVRLALKLRTRQFAYNTFLFECDTPSESMMLLANGHVRVYVPVLNAAPAAGTVTSDTPRRRVTSWQHHSNKVSAPHASCSFAQPHVKRSSYFQPLNLTPVPDMLEVAVISAGGLLGLGNVLGRSTPPVARETIVAACPVQAYELHAADVERLLRPNHVAYEFLLHVHANQLAWRRRQMLTACAAFGTAAPDAILSNPAPVSLPADATTGFGIPPAFRARPVGHRKAFPGGAAKVPRLLIPPRLSPRSAPSSRTTSDTSRRKPQPSQPPPPSPTLDAIAADNVRLVEQYVTKSRKHRGDAEKHTCFWVITKPQTSRAPKFTRHAIDLPEYAASHQPPASARPAHASPRPEHSPRLPSRPATQRSSTASPHSAGKPDPDPLGHVMARKAIMRIRQASYRTNAIQAAIPVPVLAVPNELQYLQQLLSDTSVSTPPGGTK